MSAPIYLDYNAGAPARPEVVRAMAEVLAEGGNPSSTHAGGRRSRARVEAARRSVARSIGADPAGLVFTSGGTEANALALTGVGRSRLLVSAVEHASVRDVARLESAPAEIVPVDGDGVVDLAALARMLDADARPALVSLMLANNETGIIQPVAAAAGIAHAHGALIHCDAAQGLGRVSVSLSTLSVDFLTISAHKSGGPAGIGALALADAAFPLAPMLLGGAQEGRRRAGTENLSGIVGFGVAAELAGSELERGDTIWEMERLRDRLEALALARVPGAAVIGREVRRLPNTTCLALPGVPSGTQVMALDLAGVMVGAGAACSSGRMAESTVLAAMGLAPKVAGSAIRVSLGRDSDEVGIARFVEAWAELAGRKGFELRLAAAAA